MKTNIRDRRISLGHTGGARLATVGSWLMGVLALAGCTAEIDSAPAFALDQCEIAPLFDPIDGRRVIGAEDLAYDAESGRLFVSAYDRRAAERSARDGAFDVPEGGLYVINIGDLNEIGPRLIEARPLVDRSAVPGGLRPHGVDFDPLTGEVAFINRAYQRINGKWEVQPRIERIGAWGEAFVDNEPKAPCSANDITIAGGASYVSFDHGGCGWKASLEDAFALKRSGFASSDGATEFASASFANGLMRLSGDTLALAATRENRVHLLREHVGGLESLGQIDLPGGPDNLTLASDGDIVAAVHPSLLKLALNRKLGFGRAPSRIVKADPLNGKIEILFDDPTGEVFSAATVGVVAGDLMIAGSVTDTGLLVCRK